MLVRRKAGTGKAENRRCDPNAIVNLSASLRSVFFTSDTDRLILTDVVDPATPETDHRLANLMLSSKLRARHCVVATWTILREYDLLLDFAEPNFNPPIGTSLLMTSPVILKE